MKHLLYLLTVVLFFAACSKDDEKDNAQDKWNSYVNIRPNDSFKLKATISGLTPAEIVEQSFSMRSHSYFGTDTNHNVAIGDRGTPEFMKDYENNIIKMWASDIIKTGEDGEIELQEDWLTAWNVFFVNEQVDTIAYIPNEILREAEVLIREAFEAKDYDEVYRLFDEAYTYKAIE